MEAYLQGLTMGLAYVAPIGLQNLFVINTALTQKRSRAYLTALIVIFFDVTLAFACFFGIGAIMQRFEWLRMAVLLVGSGIVIWIGIGLLRDRGPEDTAAAVDVPWAKVVTTACVVTWFNPQAIIDGTMMLGAFHAALPAGESTRFILGVTSASCLQLAGHRFSRNMLRIINLICGSVVIFYGGKLLWSFLQAVLPLLGA